MNKTNRFRPKLGMLRAGLWIALFLYNVGYASPPITDVDFAKHILWGNETNCLKVGLLPQSVPDTKNARSGFFPVLNNSCASNCLPGGLNDLWLWLPPFDSRYQMELTDTKGKPVPKTEKGRALGKPINQPLRLRTGVNSQAGYRGQILSLNSPDIIPTDWFVLEDYFMISNAGIYHFEFEMAVVWPTQKNQTNLVHLPPVQTEIEIKTP